MVKPDASSVAVAYFDGVDGKLKLTWSSSAWDANNLSRTSAAAAGWSSSPLIIDANTSGHSGGHVSIAKGQGAAPPLYLAWYDEAGGDLKFAVVRWNSGSPVLEGSPRIIDSYMTTGTRTRVSVIGGVPHVAYFSDAYTNTREAMRLARPVVANGRTWEQNLLRAGAEAGSERYTGDWEVMAVPTVTPARGYMEEFNRSQLDTYTQDGLELPVVAWTGDRLEYAKLQPPAAD
jgi:hypothetical protein